MSTGTPIPIVVQPSGQFDGNDGNWSTIALRAGTPGKSFRVLVSTLVPETWLIPPEGCTANDAANCADARGGLFDPIASTSWTDLGPFTLAEEYNLGASQSAFGDYGFETLGVTNQGSIGAVLNHQVVATLQNETDYYLGSLGLNPRTPLLKGSQQISFMASLQKQNSIPSLTYGYTAGAFYQNATVSLTLGGYDASRFISNGLSFTFGPVQNQDLLVGLQSITFQNDQTAATTLLAPENGTFAFIDSTLPYIWLPKDVCDLFATSFGLTFRASQLLYTITDAQHDLNMKQNSKVTFQIGNSDHGGSTVNITLPYSSFDHYLGAPHEPSPLRYFPLRRAQDKSQYTLGRTFLQEAYVVVDYERKNFSVSQCDFANPQQNIVTILSINSTTTNGGGTGTTGNPSTPTTSSSVSPSVLVVTAAPSSSGGLPTSAIAGIAIAVIALAILACSAAIFILLRNRRKKRRSVGVLPPELHSDAKTIPMKHDGNDDEDGGNFLKMVPTVSVSHINQSAPFEVAGRPVGSAATRDRLSNLVELQAQEMEYSRAEMASPEPPESAFETSAVSSPSLKAWGEAGTNLEPGSPDPITPLPATRAFFRTGSQSTKNSSFPSPEHENNSPVFGTGSAFQSPMVGAIRTYGNISEASSPATEKKGFLSN